ncbi:hypothetical protein [Lancefieldella sp. Marseille-Q7238]|uniref:hypothetical protein n=1 Tax=Lancefieldella sp. Marseille-Q7238 TaxID=3022127 RepID=UPI0024A989F1|nr:hypothetical protein [Lancefieldella sp. Marseille-Q7238]
MITLADLAANSGDKLVQGFINELVTDNYLLGALTFDDCMTATGTSDLVYSYKRVKTPPTAAFRALNAEPGIIPAHAGNSDSLLQTAWLSRDHPCACGEQSAITSKVISTAGSSLRMRGTYLYNCMCCKLQGSSLRMRGTDL